MCAGLLGQISECGRRHVRAKGLSVVWCFAVVTCCLPFSNSCRAVEAVGLAPKGQGGSYIQQQYERLVAPLSHQLPQQQQQQTQSTAHAGQGHSSSSTTSSSASANTSASSSLQLPVWPVNTHGGLLGFGAPWEVPAMISLVEAVTQLRGEAAGRQVEGARRALVYGNGGIFSASAVAILERCGGGVQSQAAASKL